MLFRELLNDEQVSSLREYDLGQVLTVSIEKVGEWVRNNVHTTLCAYKHERSLASPGHFFLTCTDKRLNRACGHTYSLGVLMSIMQRVIAQVLGRNIKDVKNECGNPDMCHAQSARSDEFWAGKLHELRSPSSMLKTANFVRKADPGLLATARMNQQLDADNWDDTIHPTLCAFEEVVSVLTIGKSLSQGTFN